MAALKVFMSLYRAGGGRLAGPLPASSSGVLFQWRGLAEQERVKYDSEYFDNLVKDKKVVLFMKGTPSSPMCGFSRLVVQILHMHGVDVYDHHNVLEDVNFKENLKKWSKWPTLPQLYLNGELLGGADIMLQLHQSGELVEELNKIGHRSSLIDKEKS